MTDGSRSRYAAIDAARGFAIVLMVIYHAAWDLAFFKLAPAGFFTGAGWTVFRTIILSSFLLIVGYSLVLAHGDGFRAGPFTRRLGVIIAAAVAISLVSAAVFPEYLIFFGVLHCIAVASVIALPFVRREWYWAALAGVALIAASALAFPAFDNKALGWIGFMTAKPASRDYVPLVPWAGVVLLGVAMGLSWFGANRRSAVVRTWRPRGLAMRGLAFGGRHSLAIYLLHQPILFFAIGLIAIGVRGYEPVRKMFAQDQIHSAEYGRSFTQACRRDCERNGVDKARCVLYCRCVLKEVRQNFKAAEFARQPWAPEVGRRMRGIARICNDKSETAR